MGILKAGVAVAVVVGIGLGRGLTLGWELKEFTRGPLKSEPGLRPREEEEPRTRSGAGPGESTAAVEPAQPSETPRPAVATDDPYGLNSQDCLGSEGWARRRQERVKAILGEETPDRVRGKLWSRATVPSINNWRPL